ncbi:MAG: hypothetical protein K1X53_10545 [Candidatus Sumerlaeaceae bacterium]|nr:hypothetical protein [Candidatus Sumerlaeaceae bacterium]
MDSSTQQDATPPGAGAGDERASGLSIAALLPFVRAVPALGSTILDHSHDVLGVYPAGLILGRMRIRKKGLPEECFRPAGQGSLLDLLNPKRRARLAYHDIDGVGVSDKTTCGSKLLGNWAEGHYFEIQSWQLKEPWVVFLPTLDAEAVILGLRELLGRKLVEKTSKPAMRRRPYSPRLRGYLLTAPLALGGCFLVSLVDLGKHGNSGLLETVRLCLAIALAVIGGLAAIMPFGLPIRGLNMWAARYSERRKARKREKQRQRNVDLSHRRPWSAIWVGRCLKTAAVVSVLASTLLLENTRLHLATDDYRKMEKQVTGTYGSGNTGGDINKLSTAKFQKLGEFDRAFQSLYAIFLFGPALVLAYWGYRLTLRPGRRELADDKRPPILFLRAFDDDGKMTFNPDGWESTLLGLRSPKSLRFLGFFNNFNPVRLLRLLMSSSVETAEEQLAVYVRTQGPFVAIGRPGETISTGGAARVYVGDNEWQDWVLKQMAETRLAIIQPGETRGVEWEIQQAFKALPPEKVLLILVTFMGSEPKYDAFRLMFLRMTEIALPAGLCQNLFLSFGPGWQPVLSPPLYRSPFLWPFAGCAVDFSRSLPQLAAAGQGTGWTYRRTLIQQCWVLTAVAVWLAVATGFAWIQRYAGIHTAKWYYIKSEWSRMESLLKANSMGTIIGEYPPYTLPLNKAWREDTPPGKGIRRFKLEEEGVLTIVANTDRLLAPSEWDKVSREIAEGNIKALPSTAAFKWNPPASAVPVERDGLKWWEQTAYSNEGEGTRLARVQALYAAGRYYVLVISHSGNCSQDLRLEFQRVLAGFSIPDAKELRELAGLPLSEIADRLLLAELGSKDIKTISGSNPPYSISVPKGWKEAPKVLDGVRSFVLRDRAVLTIAATTDNILAPSIWDKTSQELVTANLNTIAQQGKANWRFSSQMKSFMRDGLRWWEQSMESQGDGSGKRVLVQCVYAAGRRYECAMLYDLDSGSGLRLELEQTLSKLKIPDAAQLAQYAQAPSAGPANQVARDAQIVGGPPGSTTWAPTAVTPNPRLPAVADPAPNPPPASPFGGAPSLTPGPFGAPVTTPGNATSQPSRLPTGLGNTRYPASQAAESARPTPTTYSNPFSQQPVPTYRPTPTPRQTSPTYGNPFQSTPAIAPRPTVVPTRTPSTVQRTPVSQSSQENLVYPLPVNPFGQPPAEPF